MLRYFRNASTHCGPSVLYDSALVMKYRTATSGHPEAYRAFSPGTPRWGTALTQSLPSPRPVRPGTLGKWGAAHPQKRSSLLPPPPPQPPLRLAFPPRIPWGALRTSGGFWENCFRKIFRGKLFLSILKFLKSQACIHWTVI